MAVLSRIASVVAVSTLATFFIASPVVAETGLDARHHHAHHAAHHNVARARSQPAKGAIKKRGHKKRSCPAHTSTSIAATAATITSAATTTSTSAQATPTVVAPGPSGGKVGAGMLSHASLFDPYFDWCYTWSPWPCDGASHMQSVPMLWSEKQLFDFEALFTGGSYPEWVLGFNEPDWPDQANMSPSYAAQKWKEIMNPKPSKMVSPATTGGDSGIEWMRQFMASCAGGCKLDAMAVHWYGTTAADFIAYITKVHNEFGLPIWVTEFACHDFSNGSSDCSQDQVYAFISEAIPMLKGLDWVQRYAYFGAMTNTANTGPWNQLMSPDGSFITPMGYHYLNAPN